MRAVITEGVESMHVRDVEEPPPPGPGQVLLRPTPKIRAVEGAQIDLRDIKGEESAKRALEIAAAGGHHLLMIGSPGAGKSMLAARLPSILPPLSPGELLEVSMIASVAGEIRDGALTARRPSSANATQRTESVWSVNECSAFPVCTSHRHTVPSSPPVSARRPVGENVSPPPPTPRPVR